MQAAVKVRRTEFNLKGKIPPWLLEELKRRYGKGLRVEEDENESSVSLEDSEWFQTVRKQITPGKALRHYRENRGLTQAELGKMLGPGVRKQHVSNMEKGLRGISKNTAKKLAEIFQTSAARFI